MMRRAMDSSSLLTLFYLTIWACVGRSIIDMRIPAGIPINLNMQELCTTVDVSRSEVQYITDVLYNRSLNLLSDAELVGCRAMGVKYDPADPNAVWLTGMDFTKWITGDICADGYMVMYEFPGGKLPAGMGFRFGQGTGINFLSLCVHYHTHSADIFAGDGQGVTGESRLRVVTVAESPLARSGIKAAGVLSVYKKEGLLVPATSGTSLMYNYMIPDPIVMHAVGIAFHSHQHTSAVEIWATREDGQRTELLSASFQSWIKYDGVTFDSDFPIIRQGDRLWIHCHYNLTEVTHIGVGNKDEMCRLNLLYFVDGHKILTDNFVVV